VKDISKMVNKKGGLAKNIFILALLFFLFSFNLGDFLE
jgi:hypothetical protein